jgi:drug/metabolite transporter (DMT)-like permease
MDRKFILTGFGYAIIGLALGIYMAASKNHGQLVTHAHIMLLGFVVSFVYGVCHKLWLGNLKSGLASIQFYLHQTGTLFLAAGLFLLYGNFVGPEKLEPVLSVSSIIVLIALILMKIMMVKNTKIA